MADTCRKPRLCKVKSGPFLHEILPRRCMYARPKAYHMCFSVCLWTSVCMTCECEVFLKGVKAGTVVWLSSGGDTRRTDKSIMWSCFTVGGGEQIKACERDKGCVCACVSVWVCECVHALQPSRCFPYLTLPLPRWTFRNPWAYAEHTFTYPIRTLVVLYN